PSVIRARPPVGAPGGVTVRERVCPPQVQTKVIGWDQPLDVFERDFVIGVRVSLAQSTGAGDLAIPLHLRYQACNDVACFAPKTLDAAWTLKVAATAADARPQH